MKFAYALTAAAAATLLASGAYAQSAKFAANYATDDVTLVDITLTSDDDTLDAVPTGTELVAQIKSPRGKELLIGVSGVANLVTFTEAKGRNGGGVSTAIAEGTLALEVRYAPTGGTAQEVCDTGQIAAPGSLTFASRRQELSVTVDLDVIDDPNNDQDLAELLDIDGTVTVALGLDTTAAHHFNFVAVDLDQSTTYDVVACFTGMGHLDVDSSDVQDQNTAKTMVAVAHRMVTVQEVRAVKGSIEPLEP